MTGVPGAEWDVVVVGAGTAGCVLAARLADAGRRVLLLEAGPDHPGGPLPELLDAATMGAAVPGHPAVREQPVEVTPGRTVPVPRGRVVGGSSALYAGVFQWPTRGDLEGWAAVGGEPWAVDRLRAMLRRLPIPVRRPPGDHPLAAGFVAAAAELGYPAEPDKNGDGPRGYGPVPLAVADGVRVSTATAYLAPRRSLPGLTVRGDATVRRVVVERGRAVGVETAGGVLRAGEVVLSAGAVGSPQLLLRSGIGPADELRGAGIDVVADRPGVGHGAGDHPGLYLPFQPVPGLPPAALPLAGVLHAAGDGGPGGDDLELLPWLTPFRDVMHHPATGLPRPLGGPELAVGVLLTRPLSRGRLTLAPGDPDGPPRIVFDHLAHEADRRRLRAGVRLADRMLGSAALAGLVVARGGPGPGTDDAALDRWLRAGLTTAVHLSGTARLGRDGDPGAVVDPELRVRGVAGLRVVDTSVLPGVPSRGPAPAAVLLGELAADLMG